MKKKKNLNRKFYKQLATITIASIVLIIAMTIMINNRIASLHDSDLKNHLGLLRFGVFINSYPAIERMADYYSKANGAKCLLTRRALGTFLGYACKGHYGKAGLDKAKRYRQEYYENRKDCAENDFTTNPMVFSCMQSSDVPTNELQFKGEDTIIVPALPIKKVDFLQ